MGLEPIWKIPFDFKSNAYTNSATRALYYYTTKRERAYKVGPFLVNLHDFKSELFAEINCFGAVKVH